MNPLRHLFVGDQVLRERNRLAKQIESLRVSHAAAERHAQELQSALSEATKTVQMLRTCVAVQSDRLDKQARTLATATFGRCDELVHAVLRGDLDQTRAALADAIEALRGADVERFAWRMYERASGEAEAYARQLNAHGLTPDSRYGTDVPA